MPRNSCKAGRLWWVWTCTVGAFKPGVGKHRINAKMKQLEGCIKQRDGWLKERDEQLAVRNSDNQHLREELAREHETVRRLKAALYIEEGVNASLTARNEEVPAEEVDTQRIPVVSTN